MAVAKKWQNFQLKPRMKEGEDYMLVDSNIHQFWHTKYGSVNEIKRYGITDEDGQTIVEVYLKQVNILAFPNKTLFKLYKKDPEPTPIYISKQSTVKELGEKICRLLSGYCYMVLRNKSIIVSKVRLWVANTEEGLGELDQKYVNYTHVKLDAQVINLIDEQMKKRLHEVNMADSDTLIVEMPKDKSYVFQPMQGGEEENKHEDFQDPLGKLGDIKKNDLASLDLNKIFKRSSQRGLVGLQNLGNTCFMNSGLQCLSNTTELTKYFLFKLYREDVNTDNPLGLDGRLAEAYHGLLQDMWLGSDKRTAPYDLKRVLGKKIARFSGYGQQDACELLNYLLDLIHEDLNRVKKKPYVEVPDHDGRPDEEMSNIFWQCFLARNQSIIVDLFYGQLKSTVRCLECGNISMAFDPFLTLSLPVTKPSLFQVGFVPFEMHRSLDGSDDEDPDYSVGAQMTPNFHIVCSFEVDAKTTVGEIKEKVIEKVSQIGQRPILLENLVLGNVKWAEFAETFDDNVKAETIDQG